MPIIFISLNDSFIKEISKYDYKAYKMKIEDYIPNKKTYYVSPANSLCFMDGGIDLSLSKNVFPNIEKYVKQTVEKLKITNLLGRYYLPIGSSIIFDFNEFKSLIVAPTMLLPQDVSKTRNAYYATIAVLYNILINKNENINEIDIIFTSFCCGYGKMKEQESIKQILEAINDYYNYKPHIINKNIIINEPNLLDQPKLYQNTEWFHIDPNQIIK